AQTDNALFSIDLNAGNEAPVEAPAAPKAKPAAAAAPAPSIPEPSVTVEPAVEAPAISVGAPAEINLGEIAVAPPEAAVAPSVSADATESADAPSSLDIGGATVVPADASGGLSIEAAAPPPPPEPSAPVIAAAPAPIPEPSAPPVSEEEAAKDLPYLFAGPSAALSAGASAHAAPAINFGQQPAAHQRADMSSSGGANEDVETLKKYLTMREQDVSVLTAQLTYAKEELGKSEDTIKRLTLQGEDLFHQINDLQQKSEKLEQELQHAGKSREGELEQLRFEVKSKIDRIKFLEDRLTDSATQYEKLKERVRLDIRKIRIREKELESKLEILKKDSETLIGARENKILELKRKIDLLEFNYDTLQDKNDVEKQNVVKANEKIDRVLKVLKLAVGVIEAEGEQGSDGAQAHGSGAGTGASKVA
ncbi:MAG: hypothetical protein HY075_02150, partial [Deltaproteobacteria bacterium]|nr:hypothetical protein [Deltaproteobacteria bacterium]